MGWTDRSCLLLCTVLLITISCSKPGSLPAQTHIHLQGSTMGTSYSIKLSLPLEQNKKEISEQVERILTDINGKMSTFIEDSELSRFNNQADNDWFTVSQSLISVMTESQRISRLSRGAFDITIGPLVNLWGFGPAGKPGKIPAKQEVEATRKSCGYHLLLIRESPPALKKLISSLYCDLSAIAKGYGVDAVASSLEEVGVKHFMVEIGGEVRTLGLNKEGKSWRIGISAPSAGAEIKRIIPMSNLAMATSGDYRNYYEHDGVRYSHTINPVTGVPIQHKLGSVTVLHQSCMTADAWATAINVLGPEAGYRLAVKEKLAAYFIIREGDGYREVETEIFKTLTTKGETD